MRYFLLSFLLLLIPSVGFAGSGEAVDNGATSAGTYYVNDYGSNYDDNYNSGYDDGDYSGYNCPNYSCCRSCARFKQLRARCYFPSSSYIRRAIEMETEKSLLDEGCSKIRVSVRIRGNNNGYYNNQEPENNVFINQVGGDPFRIEVSDIDASCETEVPVEVRVRAYDRQGLRRDETQTSVVNVTGILG